MESPLISQQASDLITPSPMSIVATPRAPHKYFDQGEEGLRRKAGAGRAGARQAESHALLRAKGVGEEGVVSGLQRAPPYWACCSPRP